MTMTVYATVENVSDDGKARLRATASQSVQPNLKYKGKRGHSDEWAEYTVPGVSSNTEGVVTAVDIIIEFADACPLKVGEVLILNTHFNAPTPAPAPG